MFSICFVSYAQDKNIKSSEFQEYIEQFLDDPDEVGDIEELMGYYSELSNSKFDINMGSNSNFDKLLFLDDFQIRSIIDYRDKNGAILSESELAAINGFNEELADFLTYFIYFGDRRVPNRRFVSELLINGGRDLDVPDSEYIGVPFSSRLRYKGTWNNRVEVGLILDNDKGEPLLSPDMIPIGDFVSCHLKIEDLKLTDRWESNIILGDYYARFGQGLTLWNTFSISGGGAFYKRGEVFSPYTSAEESNYLRGIAVTISERDKLNQNGIWEFNTFFSSKMVDARVEFGEYTSIITDGIHNTLGKYETRKSMRQTNFGGKAAYMSHNIRIGVNFNSYKYGFSNGKELDEYNKFQYFDGLWGNLSFDYYLITDYGRFFGEVAMDYGVKFATLAGYLLSIDKVEVSFLLRNYSKSYIAPFSNAYSLSSGNYNQLGSSFFVSYGTFGRKLELGGDYAFYPWARFNIPIQSSTLKLYCKLSSVTDFVNWYLKGSYRYDSFEVERKMGIKGSLKWQIMERWSLGCKGEAVAFNSFSSLGGNASLELIYNWRRKLKINGSFGGFYAPDWDTRMYAYHSDLPTLYNFKLLNGIGYCGYLLVRWRLFNDCDLYIKQDIMYSIKKEEEGIYTSSSLPELKLGMQIKF